MKKKDILEEQLNTDTEVTATDTELNEAEGSTEQTETNKVKQFFITIGHGVVTCGKTLWRWTKRMFMGASKELSDSQKFDVEAIESPLKMTVKNFFRKKLAVAALVIFLVMFLFMFIGPYFIQYDLNYQDTNQKNIAPNFSMMRVSKDVKNNYESITSYSTFTVGLSSKGKLSIWGYTKLGSSGIDVSKIPSEVKNENIKFAAAGNDHIIAISETGKVYGWGQESTGQFDGMPETVDVSKVKRLICGYQSSVLVMTDGKVIAWGNSRTNTNLSQINGMEDVDDVTVMGSILVALKKDGTYTAGSLSLSTSVNGQTNVKIGDYLKGRRITAINSTYSTLALLTDDGEIITLGNFNYNENKVPELGEGEYYTSVAGGNRHYVATTNKGRIVAWGANNLNQCKVNYKGDFDEIVVCSFQNYVIKDGKVVGKWGLKGYLFGTDEFGRDVFARIIHGGRMTMTVGAVAVIVSAIIAIIVGCISGYFGGWVDMLLMRITEVFSAIPFLPFAMLLSMMLKTSPISETGRIILIMVILGLLSWTGLAHMIRGQVLAEREKEFVIAAKAMGVRESRIAFKHILPNVVSVILVSLTLDFAGCMLTESSLSYLGFGVQPPNPTWGNMLSGSNNAIVIQNYWWRWLFPAIFLAVATICINIVGDALRDILDPKSNSDR